MEEDTLNSLVSSAIWRAEQFEELGIPASAQAWAEVSLLEERLAMVHPVSKPEGRIARRGAVRAAIKAGDYPRAQALTDSYAAEESAPKSFKAQVSKILAESDRAMENRFPFASKHHSVCEAREVSLRLRKTGAFGLAA
jgi:hypothetical protein